MANLNSGGGAVTQETGAQIQQANSGEQLRGSNEDMKKVLMELDNTGYFAEVRIKINVNCKL